MNIEDDILSILREAGDKGLPLRRLALHVYNMENSLFQPLDRREVYHDVAEYLRRTSSLSGSMIERTDTRGWYRLNMNSPRVQQLLLDFSSNEADEWMM
jgi:hypothetical protein